MTDIEKAINKDIEKKYLDSIKDYEEIIMQKNAPLDAFINLSFIYWEFASEFSFRDFYEIPDKWADIGDNRYPEILEKGLVKYPRSRELRFWSKYFPHRHFFNEFTEKDCINIIGEYPDESIVPFFFLYLFDHKKYKFEREQLLESCEKLKTAKNNYIKSLIK